MSNKIAITDILDANAHNSSMALTAAWSETFRKYAMEDYESLSDDPASSFNIFMHLTAQGAAKMMYEQAARITETNVATAILPKSLLNKLTAEELSGIYGSPASTTIAFCIKKSEIIEYSVFFPEENVSRLVINKGLEVNFESHPSFTLPYDVAINCKPLVTSVLNENTGEMENQTQYNIYAYYDMPPVENDGMREVFKIYNQYISSREMRFEGETYVAFFLKVYQLSRKTFEFYVSNPLTADSTLKFENLLVGVEVFRKRANDTKTVLMTGFTEGTALVHNSYNYSYDYKRNSQNFNIIFSKMSDNSALSVGDTISGTIYSTQGELGNIEFPYMAYNINNLAAKYDQDLNVPAQNAMLNIIALVFARDQASVGGKNSKTFEEIRDSIIAKNNSRDVLISNNEITNKGRTLGLNISQVQQDLTAMYYRSSDKLTYKNMILSTGTSNFFFEIKNKERLLYGYNYYMIEPTDVFKYNPNNMRFELVPPKNLDGDKILESYNEYVDMYNTAVDKDSVLQVSFPFHMRYENTTNPKIQIYDMYVNSTEYLKFTNYNEAFALDKLDITYLRISRNPFKGSINGAYDDNESNRYYLNFVVHTGSNTLNKLYLQATNTDVRKNVINAVDEDLYKTQYVTFEIIMAGVNSKYRFSLDPTKVKIVNVDTMVNDGFIAYQATFDTNNFVSDDKEIQLRGIRNAGSVTKDYTVFMPVETTVNFTIIGTFNDPENNPSKRDCITYETDSVKLVEYITDNFKIDFDIESVVPSYKYYESDMPETYTRPIYFTNPDYNPAEQDISKANHYQNLVETVDGENVIMKQLNGKAVASYKIAHNVGDIKYTYRELTEEEYKAGPKSIHEYCIKSVMRTYGDGSKVYYTDDTGSFVFTEAGEITEFDKDTEYYLRSANIRHKKGELMLFDKNTGEIIDLPYSEASGNVNAILKPNPTEYIGICKTVPWINRLYLAGESMFEKIHALYMDVINRTSDIRTHLFDGGKIFMGLNFTSGRSNKYRPYRLSTGARDYLNDIAMTFTFRVKYGDPTSLEYKDATIKNAVIKYISELGDSDLSVDSMFEAIKAAVPDIVYINIEKMNNYNYGEVQTIKNDPSITDEVLTVSQKIVTTADGDIDFEPNITINVVQEE